MAMSGYADTGSMVRVPTLERQLKQLFEGSRPVSSVHLTNILRALADDRFIDPSIPSSSRQTAGANGAFTKLLLRIETALQHGRELRQTLELVNELVRSVPWAAIAPAAGIWLRASLTGFAQEPEQCIRLLDVLTGQQARLRPEFWRAEGGQAAGKYALLLIDTMCKEDFHRQPHASSVLVALTAQIHLQPSVFRPHAAKVHQSCIRLLFRHRCYVAKATAVLAALPTTGKGREGQTALWTATMDALIGEAEVAWERCSSTYVEYDRRITRHGSLFDLSSQTGNADGEEEDEVAQVEVAHDRLAFIIGRAPSVGVLPLFLAESTAFNVPLPIGRLHHLLFIISSLFPSSLSQTRLAPEATLHAAQAALLSHAHLCAFSCLATVPNELTSAGGHAKATRMLLTHANRGAPPIRCAAMQTLALLQMPIDPHDSLLTRCVRTCLSQLAKLVNRVDETATTDAAADSSKNGGGSARSRKRRRVYESDQVVYMPLDGFVDLDQDELAGCRAAVRWLARSLYSALLTFISPDMHDLAQTCVLMLVGMLEISLKQPDEFTVDLVQALTTFTSHSRGLLLGLLTARLPVLCAQASASTHDGTRQAASSLRLSLSDSFYPKLPPKLALRLHVESDGVYFNTSNKDGQDEERVLDDAMIDEARGTSEIEAIDAVLDISSGALQASNGSPKGTQSAHLQAPASVPTSNFGRADLTGLTASASSPSSTTALSAFLADPVKPTRRPSTPQIGSPGTLTPSVKRPSRSPERSSMITSGPTLQSASSEDGTLSRARSPVPHSPLSRVEARQTHAVNEHIAPGHHDEDDEDSDSPLPQLDVRSSDDDSEGEA